MASSGGEWVWDECHRNTVIVMSLYSSLWLVSLFQVGRILWFRHKVLSFHAGFLYTVALWMGFRSIFFLTLVDPDFPLWLDRIFYWPTLNIQFGTYTLLITFFTAYVHKKTWKEVRKRVYLLMLFTNAALFAFTVIWLALAWPHAESDMPNPLRQAQAAVTGIVFLFLSVLLAYYGWRYISVLEHSRSRGSAGLPIGSSLWHVKVFYVVAMAVFSFRWIADFIALGKGLESDIFGVDNKCLPDVLSVVSLAIWECLPVAILLLFFRRIPKTAPRYQLWFHSATAVSDPSGYHSIGGETASFLTGPMFDDESMAGSYVPYTPGRMAQPSHEDASFSTGVANVNGRLLSYSSSGSPATIGTGSPSKASPGAMR